MHASMLAVLVIGGLLAGSAPETIAAPRRTPPRTVDLLRVPHPDAYWKAAEALDALGVRFQAYCDETHAYFETRVAEQIAAATSDGEAARSVARIRETSAFQQGMVTNVLNSNLSIKRRLIMRAAAQMFSDHEAGVQFEALGLLEGLAEARLRAIAEQGRLRFAATEREATELIAAMND